MRRSTPKNLLFVSLGLAMVLVAGITLAHCQIPCGIYGDETRITLLREHITTIEKSMLEINDLSKAQSPDHNQLIRWVINKEDHAEKINEIVTAYFMAQRVKPVLPTEKEEYAKYVQRVTLLHQILVSAMKAKQTTDLEHIRTLRSLLDQFDHAYGTAEHKH